MKKKREIIARGRNTATNPSREETVRKGMEKFCGNLAEITMFDGYPFYNTHTHTHTLENMTWLLL